MTSSYTIFMDEHQKPLTTDQIKTIVKTAVREGLDEKLTSIGIDTSDPIRTQQMFQTLRDIVIFRYGVKAKLWGTAIVLGVVAGAGWACVGLVESIRSMLKN